MVDLFTDVAGQYADFTTYARGESACFEEWAEAVTEDDAVLAWLAGLPPIKQQPNLVFAAARWHGVAAPGPYAGLRDCLLGDDGAVRATILHRSTQTNEVGRLATLTPVLAGLGDGRPLALLEVGASAGLCLYPDRYAYLWHTDDGPVTTDNRDRPTLTCRVSGAGVLPPQGHQHAQAMQDVRRPTLVGLTGVGLRRDADRALQGAHEPILGPGALSVNERPSRTPGTPGRSAVRASAGRGGGRLRHPRPPFPQAPAFSLDVSYTLNWLLL